MFAGISTLQSDVLGGFLVTIHPSRSKLANMRRRATRIPTLDGGSAIVDGGYSDTDRTVVLDVTEETADVLTRLRYVCQSFAKVLLFLPDGAYKAVPESINAVGTTVTATFLICAAATVSND